MRHLYSLLAFAILLFGTPAYAEQEVGGLAIDYSYAFKKDTATANTWLSNLPENVRKAVISMELFVANPSNGLGEVKLVKVRYVPELNGSIDGAASESVQRIAALDGIKNFQKQIEPIVVSGLDARLVSVSADRWGGKLGGEYLIIYNKKTNTIWQMQLTFGKKKGLNPFASLNIDDEHRYASNLLSSITVIQ